MPTRMFCVHCGAEVDSDWRYCRSCGAEQPIESSATSDRGGNVEQQAVKRKSPRAWEPWDESQDAELARLFDGQLSVSVIAQRMQRTEGAIRSRLRRHGLLEN